LVLAIECIVTIEKNKNKIRLKTRQVHCYC
jgi:hypothetical protein